MKAYLIYCCRAPDLTRQGELIRFGPVCLFRSVAYDWIEKREAEPEVGDENFAPWMVERDGDYRS